MSLVYNFSAASIPQKSINPAFRLLDHYHTIVQHMKSSVVEQCAPEHQLEKLFH